MLEQAGVEHEVVTLPPGLHALLLRARGFPGRTVPALSMDGRRIQGSLAISRAIDVRAPRADLFPADPEERRRVEEAEAWGERELQPIPRRLFRWALARDAELRRSLVAGSGIPMANLAGRALGPVAGRFARASGADDGSVRADMERLPALLDRVDGWIAAGAIGGETPNAADHQIATTVRVLLAFEDLRPALAGRPAERLARRLVPTYRGGIPAVLPEAWRPPGPGTGH